MGFNGKIYKVTITETIDEKNTIYISAKHYKFEKKFNDCGLFLCIKEQLLGELHFERKFKNGNS